MAQKWRAARRIVTYMAVVKSLLSFAYKIGYIRFNLSAAIRLKLEVEPTALFAVVF